MKLKNLTTCLALIAVIAMLAVVACEDDSSNMSNKSKTSQSGVNTNKNDASKNPDLARLEFPRVKGGKSYVVIHRTSDMQGINYSLEWDAEKKTQRWSCYQMYSGNSGGNVGRYDTQTNGYPQDPDIPAKDRFDFDPYWGSHYDHGHICPSADRQYSEEANMQTFYISNMQPQKNVFNAGVWADMEARLRRWNTNNFRRRLYVAKGGTIDNTMQTLGTTSRGLIIPRFFFMAILCEDNSGNYKALGFWIEHKDTYPSRDDLSQYVVNIDRLEALTGIDFFCNLPDDIENEIEAASTAQILNEWKP